MRLLACRLHLRRLIEVSDPRRRLSPFSAAASRSSIFQNAKPGVVPMCAGDDHNCPQFELHRQKLLDDLDAERRSFLKSAFVAGGGAAAAWAATSGTLISPAAAQSAAPR